VSSNSKVLCLNTGSSTSSARSFGRSTLDPRSHKHHSKLLPSPEGNTEGYRLVGRCQHVIRHWCDSWRFLGSLEVGRGIFSRSKTALRHWLGRSSSCRTGFTRGIPYETVTPWTFLGLLGQLWSCFSSKQRPLSQPRNQFNLKEYLCPTIQATYPSTGDACDQPLQCDGCIIKRRHCGFPKGFSVSTYQVLSPASPAFKGSLDSFIVMPVNQPSPLPVFSISIGVEDDSPSLCPSFLRPKCRAEDRIFIWKGINCPPPSTIDNPVIQAIALMASYNSLRDSQAYGAGLRKFHIFCDVFSIRESARLPASVKVIHSFALWAATDPSVLDPLVRGNTRFEPVAITTVRKYLSAIRAWHLIQGWPDPLTDLDHERINWSLCGLQNMFGKRSRPVRPPITIPMLRALKTSLKLMESFDACVWDMACCAFWGMMRFGEVSVKSRTSFHGDRHLKRKDSFVGLDMDGRKYIRLDLPSAKTASTGEIQSVFMTTQSASDLCPIEALENLARITPAGASDPLFSWRNGQGDIHPMVRDKALNRINTILKAWGWGTAFGHSFRIGGASFFLAQKIDLEIVRIAGRWKSLAYETYIRAFELIANRHMGNISVSAT
jgi:hypothetical protein